MKTLPKAQRKASPSPLGDNPEIPSADGTVFRILEIGQIVQVHRFGAPPALAMVTGIVDEKRGVAHINLVAFEVVGLTFELDVPFEPEPCTSTERRFWVWPPSRTSLEAAQ